MLATRIPAIPFTGDFTFVKSRFNCAACNELRATPICASAAVTVALWTVVFPFCRRHRSEVGEVRLRGVVKFLLTHCSVLHKGRIALYIQLRFELRGFGPVNLGLGGVHVGFRLRQSGVGNV
jgi:hypothetical protein